MELSIASLKELGAFTGAPVQKDITWDQNGTQLTATVYVRPLAYQAAVSDLVSRRNEQDPVAGRIAACICDAAGNPVFTVGDITGAADPQRGALDGNLTVALLAVIGEVTNAGKTSPSAS